MNEVVKTEIENGYAYSIKGSKGFADAEIQVVAEIGGHGCLFGIKFPEVSIISSSHSGPDSHCCFEDFCRVLNRIMDDYNMNYRIFEGVRGFKEIV